MVTSFRTTHGFLQTKANFTIPKPMEPWNFRSQHFGALWLCRDCSLVLLRPKRTGGMEMHVVLLVGSTLKEEHEFRRSWPSTVGRNDKT